MDIELKAKFEEYLNWDRNPETRNEIQSIKNYDELRIRLFKRLAFGTAGLRGKMGGGYNQMNDLVIIQTSQGLVETCKKYDHSKGIIIGYDARWNSEKWAKIVANIFHRASIKVYLFSDTVPTPFVAFSVRHFNALCGVMITASHNPKDDNGYKVYWDNGSQIIPPRDSEISNDIRENLIPKETSYDFESIRQHTIDPMHEVESVFYDLQYKLLHREVDSKALKNLKVVYTPMHGVGWPYCKKMLTKFGVENVIPVKEQVERDPNFPTVPFPNPEEKGALDLAMKTASENNVPIVIASDPDADRFAAAECVNGKWKVFSGNELGSLFGWWIWKRYENSEFKKEDLYMLSSTVSSKILKSIADKEGFGFVDTLTGFKWMGNLSSDLLTQGKHVIFAFEEAIGFMCGPSVLDKDGVSTCAIFAEMAAYLYNEGQTVSDQLAEIFKRYGLHITNNGYLKSSNSEVTIKMFQRLRNWENQSNKYPEYCGDPKFKITKIRDLTTGYYSYEENYKLPSDASNQMITFTFSNNCTLTIRASGTEPKIKYYSEIILDPDNKSKSLEDVQKELEELIELVKKHFYQKAENGFTD